MDCQILLYLFLLINPLLGAPPSVAIPDPSDDLDAPTETRSEGIKCFLRGVRAPNPVDCYRALSQIMCSNNTIDNTPLRFTTYRGVLNTVLLPLRWAEPGCLIIVDVTSSASGPLGIHPDDNLESDTTSLIEIATLAQQITEHCVTGGSRLGGKSAMGENNLLSVYVANHPAKEPAPIAVVPVGNSEYPTLTDLAMG
ncbi:hypothetical protein MMC14_008532, partial [Varicellaria rhodocarpa]|nr:hypothetical protein [Varicellaria rhodocarpa]